jgi:polyisoprenoid-binding protein YceI
VDTEMTNPIPETLAPHAAPGDLVADLAACTATFAVRNLGLLTVTGQIPVTNATVTIGPDGQPLAVHAELDARGIDTGNQRRDSHLRSARFLDTGQWPAITFEARAIQSSHDGWTVRGILTVKGNRCPVQLDVTGPDLSPGDPDAAADLHATGHLDRRSAGISAPAFLIGHRISLSLAARLQLPLRDSAQPKHGRHSDLGVAWRGFAVLVRQPSLVSGRDIRNCLRDLGRRDQIRVVPDFVGDRQQELDGCRPVLA